MSQTRFDTIRYGRDVAPCMPHTISVYKRPRNDEQLPRWLQHRCTDNWNQPTYVYSPGISGQCHFYRDSKFHWQPPVDDRTANRARLQSSSGSMGSARSSPRGFQLPVNSPFASAPSSPRLRSHWHMSRQGSYDNLGGSPTNSQTLSSPGSGARDQLYVRSPPSTAGSQTAR